MANNFDLLRSTLKKMLAKKVSSAKAGAGARSAKIQHEAANRSVWEDPEAMLEEICSQSGLRGSVHSFAQTSGDHYASDYSAILGDLAEGDSWALVVNWTLSRDKDFDVPLTIILLEGREQIQAAIEDANKETLSIIADRMMESVDDRVLVDPVCLLDLLHALREHPRGKELMKVWDASVAGSSLEVATPPAPINTPRPRP